MLSIFIIALLMLSTPTWSIAKIKTRTFHNCRVCNNLTTGNMCALNDANISGNLKVGGNATICGDLEISENTNINGDINLNGNLTVSQDVDIDGSLNVSQDTTIAGDTTISGDLTVDGTINGTSSSDLVISEGSSDPNAVARFADDSGTLIKNSSVFVDDSGNIQIDGISKNGYIVSWPSTTGAAGTFLESDGAGNLVYGTPAGGGNVSTAASFSSNNAIITTDLLSGTEDVKDTTVYIDAFNNITGVNTLTAATSINSPKFIGNADTATSFTGPLAGDVSGTQDATVVDTVGGKTAAEIAAATDLANTATDSNIVNTIVKRDASGNFSAGTITANLTGNVTGDLTGNADTATYADSTANFTGPLAGDVSGTQDATVVDTVGGKTAAEIAAGTDLANTATSENVVDTIVKRDASGNFEAGTITANLTGNVTGDLTGNADTATDFTGSLVGDVSGTQGATVVDTVGGQTSAQITSGVIAANAATNTNTPNTIVKRDTSGNFSAGTITADLTGNVTGNLIGNADTATNATTAVNFSGALSGDVTGNQGTTQVISVGGQSAANVASATVLANQATNINTGGRIVRRDGDGNFSASTITATLIGDVTGDLTGNADTATNATTADSATTFTGALAGDVTGYQSTTTVSFVGGQTATDVAAATLLALAATSNDEANKIVKRDNSSKFEIDKITINGTIVNANDAATKEYVDNATSTGIIPKTPALVVSITDVASLSGSQTIDGVSVPADERVLLTAQTTTTENGLWLTQVSTWTRTTDFASGSTAGQAYVLTTSGTAYAGTGWLCSTPDAVVNTDPISFVQFSAAGQTTAANVGTGDGKIYRDKTGQTLNLKTLAAATYMQITNNTDDITIGTNATSDLTPSTIVARDGTNTFAGNLTGPASDNVLKAGDTMTGDLNMAAQKEVRFQDTVGGEYVGLRAPTTVGASYTVDLPPNPPVAGQFLKAVTSSTTTWTVVDPPPAATKTYYVSLVGNDSNDGSLSAPFRTISHAVDQANAVATLSNPVSINVGSGIFIEDNSGGSIAITAEAISIKGTTESSTIVMPFDESTNLFDITAANAELTNLMFRTTGTDSSTASAINVTTDVLGSMLFKEMEIYSFQTGISASSSTGDPVIVLKNSILANNITCVSYTNVRSLIQSNLFRGTLSNTPTNTGINVTGTLAEVALLDCFFTAYTTAINVAGGSHLRMVADSIETTENSVVCTGGSKCQIVGTLFALNVAGTINVSASGAGTKIYIEGSLFDCEDASDTPRGTALKATTEAEIIANDLTIEEAETGIECGTGGDTDTTEIKATDVSLVECTTDITQLGSSKLLFVGGIFDATKLSIADPINVHIAAFNGADDEHLAFGNTTDNNETIYQILNDTTSVPSLEYEPSYYGNQGTVYKNPNANSTVNATQAASNDAHYYVVTGDRTKEATVNLISDTGNFGNNDNVRGWEISKTGTQADLAFTYTNSDSSGLAVRGKNSVMQLNGFDNQVEFPTATNTPLPTNTTAKLVWATDTNLYRDSANTLKTDDDLIIGGLTANRAVTTDANKKLTSSATTDTELGYLSGVTSSIQTQIDGKVDIAGDTMTGALQLPAGTTALPSLKFTGGTTTGLSSNSDNLSLSTSAAERMKISSTGTVSINEFTSSGVVHNDASGNLTSSLIVNADVSPSAAIVDTKLATISTTGKVANSATTATSANTPNTIVERDGSGDFSAGTITANLIGTVSGCVAKAGDTMTGTLTLPAGTAATPSLQFTGSTNTGISAATANTLSFDTNGVERMAISTAAITTISPLLLNNIYCNQAIQTVAPATNDTINVLSTTSILLLTHTAVRNGVTIVFPPSPTNGQLFTIMLGTTFTINYTNDGNGASVVNEIIRLNPAANFTTTLNGTSVTYLYSSAANTWYRCGRG